MILLSPYQPDLDTLVRVSERKLRSGVLSQSLQFLHRWVQVHGSKREERMGGMEATCLCNMLRKRNENTQSGDDIHILISSVYIITSAISIFNTNVDHGVSSPDSNYRRGVCTS